VASDLPGHRSQSDDRRTSTLRSKPINVVERHEPFGYGDSKTLWSLTDPREAVSAEAMLGKL
jgi:hypothetical protein